MCKQLSMLQFALTTRQPYIILHTHTHTHTLYIYIYIYVQLASLSGSNPISKCDEFQHDNIEQTNDTLETNNTSQSGYRKFVVNVCKAFS